MDEFTRVAMMTSVIISGVTTVVVAMKYLWSKKQPTVEHYLCYILLSATGGGAIVAATFLAKM